MMRWRLMRLASWAAVMAAIALLCLLTPMSPEPSEPVQPHSTITERSLQSTSAVERSLQSTSAPSTDFFFLTANTRQTIRSMERHLFRPEVREEVGKLFRSRVEHDGTLHTFPSFRYTFEGFWRNWKRMMRDGVPTGNTGLESGGVGGKGKFVLFAGDENERYVNMTRDPYRPQPKREIRIFGYEYGLANMALFLSQAMVDGIYMDACDEINEQERIDRNGKQTNVWPISNACGQYNSSYEDLTCPPGEEEMQCPPLPATKIIEGSFASGQRGMVCGPADVYAGGRNHYNDYERINVEGCCWWGRGPLHSKGRCTMGKLNYFLGAKALADSRISLSTPGVYGNTDFCLNPEAVCADNDEDMMWTVAMFDWAERMQRYTWNSADGSKTWNYQEKLVEFVNSGMNMFEYYSEDVDTDRAHAFIHEVSAIVDRGCHDGPQCKQAGPVNRLSMRRTAFTVALAALHIPTMREELVAEQVLDHLTSRREKVESNLLVYKTEQGTFPSQRYTFDDFYDALFRFSRPYDASNSSYPVNATYFYSPDHSPFYTGKPYMKHGHKYGLANMALFLSNGLELSVENDETCDELNMPLHAVSGKLPLSNSCGPMGLSYQDMICEFDPDLACPVDPNMYITAVTSDRAIGAPPPLQCSPRSRVPSTGYWDFEEMQESEVSYANENARVDLEGCCWWGRGILQTRGVCSFGRLNYYLGKRAADEGREALFPSVDLCANPEAICGSQYKHELVWMSGMFKWVDEVQSYDRGGFNYIERLHAFADDGMRDDVFIKSVGAIVQKGCHNPPCRSAGCADFPCDGASPVDENAGVTKAFRTFFELDLWNTFPDSPGGSNAPTPSPTQCQENCTEWPSASPMYPTSTPSEPPVFILSTEPSQAPSRLMDARLADFEEFAMHLKSRRQLFESTVFVSEATTGSQPSTLYTLDGFINALRDLATEGLDGSLFYIGQGDVSNFNLGLVNVGLFLAHAMTRGIPWDTCEEVNHHLVNGKLPLSNSCGQHGRSNSNDICPLAQAAMECKVDTSMNLRQTSVGNSESPPFFCGPTSTYPFTGYFDPLTGDTVSSAPFANEGGRQDVEGCCFWGRGILLNQGLCDIGRFNWYFGLPAFVDERSTGRYNVDFCSNPDALCSDFTIPATGFNQFPTTVDTSAVRYQIGLLYWIDYVQSYRWGFWDYMEKLKLFTDGGMNDFSFVDEFSEIVLDSTRDNDQRKANFRQVLGALFAGEPTRSPTKLPTRQPTEKPSLEPTAAPASSSIDGNATWNGTSGYPGQIPGQGGGFGPGAPGMPASYPNQQPGVDPISATDQQPGAGPNAWRPSGPVSIDLSAPSYVGTTTINDLNEASFHSRCAGAGAVFLSLAIMNFL